jgi:hypothetical protein
MDAAGAARDVAIAPAELVRLYDEDGPVATVYLTTEAKVENASQRSLARWRDLRETMEANGVPAAALDAMAPVVADAHHEGEGLAVVSGAGGLRHIEHLSRPPAGDRGWWEGLPVLGHVLHERQGHLPHVIVLVDHEGADIHAVGPTGGQRQESVGGVRYPVSKVASGGWSQTHHQRRAEGNWATSARRVAAELERVASEVGAVVIVAAGDARSLTLLEEHLAEDWRERWHKVPGGTGELEREAHRLVADAAARRTVTALEEFRQQLGEQSRAAAGAAETVDALRQGRVDVLLVHHDPADDRRGWFGPGRAEVSLTASRAYPGEARLMDVLVRAAFQTGAGVRVVPGAGGPPEGVGALLRWA